jgi:hypothetical protein
MAKLAAIKLAISALSDPKIRKLMIGSCLAPFVFIILVVCFFILIISGIFAFIMNVKHEAEWSRIMAHLERTFSVINANIENDIKKEVYIFMPEFSINLSKATIAESFDNNFLLLYDSGEYENAMAEIRYTSNTIRSEINRYISSGEPIPPHYIEYANDVNFMNANTDDYEAYASYSGEVLDDLLGKVRATMSSYNYEIEEIEDENGKITRTQTLTVDDGTGFKSIVEYRQIGGGTLYAPELLAMFQARQMSYVLNDDREEDENEQFEDDFEIAFGELPDDDEDEISEEYTDNVWDGLNDSGQSGVGLLGVFQTNSLMTLLRESIKDGSVSARIEYEYGDDYEKLIVILELPSSDEWGDIFELDDDQKEIAKENESIIKQILDEAGVPEEKRYLSLDDAVQAALFVYFQGFFNLPVESSDLRPGGNGIVTTLGERETIHRYGTNALIGTYERGITLDLNSANTAIKIELLPVGDCIKEVYIFDVCENPAQYANRSTVDGLFQYPAITLAFVIDRIQFYDDYGFFFPVIKNGVGDVLRTDDKYVTLYLEFSCLDRLAYGITERNIGQMLDLYSGGEPFVIGYCHNGLPSEERGDNYPAVGTFTHRLDKNNPTPHVCIKMAFSRGLPDIVRWEQDFGATRGGNNYRNMRFNNVGETVVNPLLWFKAFRTDLKGVAPLVPKKGLF